MVGRGIWDEGARAVFATHVRVHACVQLFGRLRRSLFGCSGRGTFGCPWMVRRGKLDGVPNVLCAVLFCLYLGAGFLDDYVWRLVSDTSTCLSPWYSPMRCVYMYDIHVTWSEALTSFTIGSYFLGTNRWVSCLGWRHMLPGVTPPDPGVPGLLGARPTSRTALPASTGPTRPKTCVQQGRASRQRPVGWRLHGCRLPGNGTASKPAHRGEQLSAKILSTESWQANLLIQFPVCNRNIVTPIWLGRRAGFNEGHCSHKAPHRRYCECSEPISPSSKSYHRNYGCLPRPSSLGSSGAPAASLSCPWADCQTGHKLLPCALWQGRVSLWSRRPDAVKRAGSDPNSQMSLTLVCEFIVYLHLHYKVLTALPNSVQGPKPSERAFINIGQAHQMWRFDWAVMCR